MYAGLRSVSHLLTSTRQLPGYPYVRYIQRTTTAHFYTLAVTLRFLENSSAFSIRFRNPSRVSIKFPQIIRKHQS